MKTRLLLLTVGVFFTGCADYDFTPRPANWNGKRFGAYHKPDAKSTPCGNELKYGTAYRLFGPSAIWHSSCYVPVLFP